MSSTRWKHIRSTGLRSRMRSRLKVRFVGSYISTLLSSSTNWLWPLLILVCSADRWFSSQNLRFLSRTDGNKLCNPYATEETRCLRCECVCIFIVWWCAYLTYICATGMWVRRLMPLHCGNVVRINRLRKKSIWFDLKNHSQFLFFTSFHLRGWWPHHQDIEAFQKFEMKICVQINYYFYQLHTKNERNVISNFFITPAPLKLEQSSSLQILSRKNSPL